MMSKSFWNFEKFILSHSNKNRAFSEVCKDMIGDLVRLYFKLRHADYPEEKWACVPTVAKVAGFPCSRFPHPLIFIAILIYLNLNFYLSWIVQPFAYEEIDLGFSHVAATTQKTAGHDKRNTKINESQSSCLWSLHNAQYE